MTDATVSTHITECTRAPNLIARHSSFSHCTESISNFLCHSNGSTIHKRDRVNPDPDIRKQKIHIQSSPSERLNTYLGLQFESPSTTSCKMQGKLKGGKTGGRSSITPRSQKRRQVVIHLASPVLGHIIRNNRWFKGGRDCFRVYGTQAENYYSKTVFQMLQI